MPSLSQRSEPMQPIFLKLRLSAPLIRSCQNIVKRCLSSTFARTQKGLTVALTVMIMLMVSLPAHGVEPDEILDDPVLESRAREISKEVRCLVCRNESIDDSGAALAKDLRLLVRERLVAGDTDDEVRDYLVERFGEYVLLKPPFSIANAALWLAGPLIFLIGLLISLRFIRSQKPAAPAPLSSEEQAALDKLLKD